MLAWIIPISDANPPGGGGQPVYPSQGGPFPTNPIVVPPGGAWPTPPQPPLGIWGGPWFPPYPSQGPGFPTHPIQLPPWAGGSQPYPDQGLPKPPVVPVPPTDPKPPAGFEWVYGYSPVTGEWRWMLSGTGEKPKPEPTPPAEPKR